MRVIVIETVEQRTVFLPTTAIIETWLSEDDPTQAVVRVHDTAGATHIYKVGANTYFNLDKLLTHDPLGVYS